MWHFFIKLYFCHVCFYTVFFSHLYNSITYRRIKTFKKINLCSFIQHQTSFIISVPIAMQRVLCVFKVHSIVFAQINLINLRRRFSHKLMWRQVYDVVYWRLSQKFITFINSRRRIYYKYKLTADLKLLKNLFVSGTKFQI